METTIIANIISACPVLASLIWFLVYQTKENNKRFALQAEQFQQALDKVVDRIGDRLERIESTITILYERNE